MTVDVNTLVRAFVVAIFAFNTMECCEWWLRTPRAPLLSKAAYALSIGSLFIMLLP